MRNNTYFKKIIVVTVIFALFSATLFAQTEDTTVDNTTIEKSEQFSHHEVYLGYGYPQSVYTYVLYGLTGLSVATISGGNSTMDIKGAGTYSLGYNWYPLDWLALGGTMTGEFFSLNYTDNNSSNAIVTKENMFNGSIQGKITAQYGKNWVYGYHGLSLGVMLFSGSEVDLTAALAFNVTLAGIKIGPAGPGIKGFVECCFGTNSLINAGVIYSF